MSFRDMHRADRGGVTGRKPGGGSGWGSGEHGARGSLRSWLSLALILGALACATDVEPQAEQRMGSREAPAAPQAEPQRVVQHLAPGASASDAPSAGSAAAARRGQAITPKHLEAELDRLEAELAK